MPSPSLISEDNLKTLLDNSLSRTYHIEQKKGNLKEIFTARINNKIRMYIKPDANYPYDQVKIEDVLLTDIDDKHYGEG